MKETPSQLFSNKFRNEISTNRAYKSERWGAIFESERKNKENVIRNYENHGSGKFVSEGTIARLKALPLDIPENILLEGDIISYYYGYYERGTRLIRILIEEGCVKTGNVEITPENFEIELEKIAINDGMNPEIDFNSLPEVIKNNIIYKSGFDAGREIEQSKKSRR